MATPHSMWQRIRHLALRKDPLEQLEEAEQNAAMRKELHQRSKEAERNAAFCTALQEQLEEAKRDAESSRRLLAHFEHDLGGPAANLRALAASLKERVDPSDVRQVAKQIEKNCAQLLFLCDQLHASHIYLDADTEVTLREARVVLTQCIATSHWQPEQVRESYRALPRASIRHINIRMLRVTFSALFDAVSEHAIRICVGNDRNDLFVIAAGAFGPLLGGETGVTILTVDKLGRLARLGSLPTGGLTAVLLMLERAGGRIELHRRTGHEELCLRFPLSYKEGVS